MHFNQAMAGLAEATSPWEAWTTLSRLGGAMPSPGAALPGLAMLWMQEGTRFMAERLRADADAVAALGACASPTEAAALQQRWMQEAGRSFAEASLRDFVTPVPDVSALQAALRTAFRA